MGGEGCHQYPSQHIRLTDDSWTISGQSVDNLWTREIDEQIETYWPLGLGEIGLMDTNFKIKTRPAGFGKEIKFPFQFQLGGS